MPGTILSIVNTVVNVANFLFTCSRVFLNKEFPKIFPTIMHLHLFATQYICMERKSLSYFSMFFHKSMSQRRTLELVFYTRNILSSYFFNETVLELTTHSIYHTKFRKEYFGLVVTSLNTRLKTIILSPWLDS